MTLFFFNKEIENPVLRVIITLGAVVFTISVVVSAMVIALPIIGVALTGAMLIAGIILIVVLVTVPFISFFGILFSNKKKGSGIEKSKIIEVDQFNMVKLSGIIKADIVCGESQLFKITTDDNLLDSVKVSVEKQELSVSFDSAVSSKIGIKVQIEVPFLTSFNMSGATKAIITNVDSQDLLLKGNGASKAFVSGECRNARIVFSGVGNLSAGELNCLKMKIKISGSAKAVVHPIEELNVKISGAGKVTCLDTPEKVTKHISGAGKLDFVNNSKSN